MRCDPPLKLTEVFLQKLLETTKSEGRFDAILVPGDLVAHGIAMEFTDPSIGNYQLLKKSQAAVADLFKQYFPDTLIVPTLGNNDGKYHNQAIDPADKADFYSTFFAKWFE